MPGLSLALGPAGGPQGGTGLASDGNFGFRPTNLSGNVLWLSADDPGIVISGGAVSLWPDRSGLGHDASQSTAGQRPTLSTTGFGIASRPYILFDATDDNLVIADSADFEFGTGTFAVFIALRFVSGSGGFKCPIGKGSDTAGSGWRCFRVSTNTLTQYRDGGIAYTTSTLTIGDGVDTALQWGVDAQASVSLYAKTTTRERAGITVGAITDTANDVKIGQDNTAAFPYQANVRVAEIIAYKRPAASGFSDAETQVVMNYLIKKYGI